MPLYDYACRRCDHEFEALVSSAEEEVECPECHSRHIKRALSVPAKPRSESTRPAHGLQSAGAALWTGVLQDVKGSNYRKENRSRAMPTVLRGHVRHVSLIQNLRAPKSARQ